MPNIFSKSIIKFKDFYIKEGLWMTFFQIIKSIFYRVKLVFRKIHWYVIGFPKYYKTSLLLPPLVNNETPGNSKMLIDYYENGIAAVPIGNLKESSSIFLESVKSLFEENFEKYTSSIIKDEYVKFFDKKGRYCIFNNAEGIFQVQMADPNHPLYTKFISNFYKGCESPPYTISKGLSEYSYLKNLLAEESFLKLAHYANFGDINPLTIKIERKTYTFQEKKYNEHYIHMDTDNISTFKNYVYLNNVDETNGALAISNGSHHWKLYPKLLEYLKVRKNKTFSLKYIKRLKIPPILPFFGEANKVFGFTGNAVHRATNVHKGKERWTIQIYYYSLLPWSTEKS